MKGLVEGQLESECMHESMNKVGVSQSPVTYLVVEAKVEPADSLGQRAPPKIRVLPRPEAQSLRILLAVHRTVAVRKPRRSRL